MLFLYIEFEMMFKSLYGLIWAQGSSDPEQNDSANSFRPVASFTNMDM